MKKAEVKIGRLYLVKVSDKVVPVRIDAEHGSGKGWVGTNTVTGRQVRIKTAQRLRGPAPANDASKGKPAPAATEAAQGKEKDAGKGNDTKATEEATPGDTGAAKSLSCLDAAAKVLEEAGEPLGCRDIYGRAEAAGYWSSDGKTPWATIYSAMYREIKDKGAESRFVKGERGKFARA